MFAILALGRLKQKSSRPFWEIQQDIGGGVERKRGREAEGRRRRREKGMAKVVVYHLISAVDRYLRTNEGYRL